jgi:hypothetical protein
MSSARQNCCNPSDCFHIVTEEHGEGAIKPKTVIEVFAQTVEQYGNQPALCFKPKDVRGKPRHVCR